MEHSYLSDPVPRSAQNGRILIITLGQSEGTSAQLFKELSLHISQVRECRVRAICLAKGGVLKKFLALWTQNAMIMRDLLWSHTIVTHAFLLTASPIILLGKLLGKRVVVFQWDVYPCTIAGRRVAPHFTRKLAYQLERAVLSFCDLLVLPSRDFLPHFARLPTAVLPLWPQSHLKIIPIENHKSDAAVHIAFCGQLNELRGLNELLNHLSTSAKGTIVFHIFSRDSLTMDHEVCLGLNLTIVQEGELDRDELQHRLSKMHFGVVSLHPQFDQPAFPSKTFDYLAAGLPILYFGPALPGFTNDLIKNGVGINITYSRDIDLRRLHDSIMPQMDLARERYIAFTRLSRKKVADIL